MPPGQDGDSHCDPFLEGFFRASQVQRFGLENTVTHGQAIWTGESKDWYTRVGTSDGNSTPPTDVLTLLNTSLLPLHSASLCTPSTAPTPPPFPSAQRQVKAQMEQTSESKLGVRRPWLGRIQSNLPPVSRLAFDYVDDKDCKQNSLSLLISSLRRTLNIFNYAVWKAAVTQSGWCASALLSLPTWTKYFLVFSASHT